MRCKLQCAQANHSLRFTMITCSTTIDEDLIYENFVDFLKSIYNC